jgi:flagellin
MYTITSSSGGAGIAYQLNQNSKNLQRSLQRLSSMKRVNSSVDDPAGLAVSMKLGVQIRKTEAVMSGMSTASSYLETQDGVLSVANNVLGRMAYLAQLSAGSSDSNAQAAYQVEFSNLQSQINGMLGENFNGLALFGGDGDTTVENTDFMAATINISGETMSISQLDFQAVTNLAGSSGISIASSASAASAASAVSSAINNLALLRATNGSEQNRINFATDLLDINKLNLEAANSRIVDLDLASEMVNFSKYTFIENASLALLAQANARNEKIIKLLE